MSNNYHCEVGCEGSMDLPCGICSRSQFDGFPEFKQVLKKYHNGEITLDNFFKTMFSIRDEYLKKNGINVTQFEKNKYKVDTD
jgi:hypothetical protein